jgi:2-hydroxychromene-2-carboxylate isomerase
VLLAAAACEMHPRVVLQSLERDSVYRDLTTNTALAMSAGVRSVPAIRIGERIFDGQEALRDAHVHFQKTAGGER